MLLFIENLYGVADGHKAYYRKRGDCFDFVNSKECASNLSIEDVNKIMQHAEWYKKNYNANIIGIEE